MEHDREIDQVLLNIKGTSNNIISVSLLSARITLQLMIFLLRLAKKGLVSAGFTDKFKEFLKKSEGNYTVYNIPLSAGKADKIRQLNELGLKLQETRNPAIKASLNSEMKKLQKEIPELDQLKRLGVGHCILPKLNGSDQTIQVAVDKKDDQMFKNWFLNHLTSELSGGEKGMEDIKVLTEGNYSIYNIPFEGEELKEALSDFDILGMNYSVLPDLKVGDNNSQIAVPNSDRGRLETWFKMWKEKQIREGKETGEMYSMDQESYLSTSTMEAGDYVAASEQKFKDANQEFEAQSKQVPWQAALQKENSEEYVRFLQDNNYEKITINKESLVENMSVSAKAEEMRRNGYFISRIPGTYNENQKTLILPVNQVFTAEQGQAYLAFLPKNENSIVADFNGKISDSSFAEIYRPYEQVNRSMNHVQRLRKGASLSKEAARKTAEPKTVKTPTPNVHKTAMPKELKL